MHFSTHSIFALVALTVHVKLVTFSVMKMRKWGSLYHQRKSIIRGLTDTYVCQAKKRSLTLLSRLTNCKGGPLMSSVLYLSLRK